MGLVVAVVAYHFVGVTSLDARPHPAHALRKYLPFLRASRVCGQLYRQVARKVSA
jgi:hypothetical protein